MAALQCFDGICEEHGSKYVLYVAMENHVTSRCVCTPTPLNDILVFLSVDESIIDRSDKVVQRVIGVVI